MIIIFSFFLQPLRIFFNPSFYYHSILLFAGSRITISRVFGEKALVQCIMYHPSISILYYFLQYFHFLYDSFKLYERKLHTSTQEKNITKNNLWTTYHTSSKLSRYNKTVSSKTYPTTLHLWKIWYGMMGIWTLWILTRGLQRSESVAGGSASWPAKCISVCSYQLFLRSLGIWTRGNTTRGYCMKIDCIFPRVFYEICSETDWHKGCKQCWTKIMFH